MQERSSLSSMIFLWKMAVSNDKFRSSPGYPLTHQMLSLFYFNTVEHFQWMPFTGCVLNISRYMCTCHRICPTFVCTLYRMCTQVYPSQNKYGHNICRYNTWYYQWCNLLWLAHSGSEPFMSTWRNNTFYPKVGEMGVGKTGTNSTLQSSEWT